MNTRYWRARTEFYPINKGQNIRSKGCASIVFKNIGTGDMILNDVFTIGEGQTFGNAMPHPDMYDDSEYRIKFTNPATGAGVAILVYATAVDESGNQVGTSPQQICEKF